METKISGKRVEKLISTRFAVDSDGLSGGIGLFWSSAVTVDIKSSKSHHNYAVVQCKDSYVPSWQFPGIYGESRRDNRHLTWTLIRRLHQL
jgi:hypothetical protein